jgi:hypothetical protein
MKTTVVTLLSLFLGTVSTAWGAVDSFEDRSGLFCWIFMGFCALIVVAQLLPAIMMMTGMAKGAAKSMKSVEERAAK